MCFNEPYVFDLLKFQMAKSWLVKSIEQILNTRVFGSFWNNRNSNWGQPPKNKNVHTNPPRRAAFVCLTSLNSFRIGEFWKDHHAFHPPGVNISGRPITLFRAGWNKEPMTNFRMINNLNRSAVPAESNGHTHTFTVMC